MSAGLDLARWIIDEHRPDGSCPRAAAILLRQHLEATMARRRVALPEADDQLAGRGPPRLGATHPRQPRPLPRGVGEPSAAGGLGRGHRPARGAARPGGDVSLTARSRGRPGVQPSERSRGRAPGRNRAGCGWRGSGGAPAPWPRSEHPASGCRTRSRRWPARSAMARSTTTSRIGASRPVTRSVATVPAKSSALVTTE